MYKYVTGGCASRKTRSDKKTLVNPPHHFFLLFLNFPSSTPNHPAHQLAQHKTMDPTHAQLVLRNLQSDNLSNWGFTLYRTDYAPENESKWTELVERINRAEYEDVCTEEEDDGAISTVAPGSVQRRVWEAFKLDVRSDKQLYDGADLDTLRKVRTDELRESAGLGNDADAEELQLAVPVQSWVFLVADTEALNEGLQGGWIKAVDAEYKAEDHASSADGGFQQEYWGWMRVKLGVLNSVWMQLQVLSGDMEEIAPPSSGGPHAARVYDGDMRY